jgi:hypothetical protein
VLWVPVPGPLPPALGYYERGPGRVHPLAVSKATTPPATVPLTRGHRPYLAPNVEPGAHRPHPEERLVSVAEAGLTPEQPARRRTDITALYDRIPSEKGTSGRPDEGSPRRDGFPPGLRVTHRRRIRFRNRRACVADRATKKYPPPPPVLPLPPVPPVPPLYPPPPL